MTAWKNNTFEADTAAPVREENAPRDGKTDARQGWAEELTALLDAWAALDLLGHFEARDRIWTLYRRLDDEAFYGRKNHAEPV